MNGGRKSKSKSQSQSKWLLAWCGLGCMAAHAALTPAGQVIANQAALEFQVSGAAAQVRSNVAQFTVLQLLDVALSWQDAGDVGVNAPDGQKVLTFQLVNTGNGAESYRLRRQDSLPGSGFDPLPSAVPLYLENGLEPGFQASGPHADTPYVPGANDPLLAAGQTRVVYLVSDIPAGLPDAATGLGRLMAESAAAGVPGSRPGLGLAPLAPGQPERVVGRSQGRAEADGRYRVTGLRTLLTKEVISVHDPQGGTLWMPGTEVRYRLRLRIEGVGEARNILVADDIPAHLHYKPGSLSLNGAALTDAEDADAGEWLAPAARVQVRLGTQTLTASNPAHNAQIEFTATID